LNTHISAVMRAFIEAHPDWLTEARLPAYAPDLNAVEGAWANMKNGLGNLAAADVDQLTAIVKNRLKSIQYRPALIDAFLAQTGLTEPSNPNRPRHRARLSAPAAELAQLSGQHSKAHRLPAQLVAGITIQPGIQRPHQPSWATRAIKCLVGEEQAIVPTLDAIPRPQRRLWLGHCLEGVDKAGKHVHSQDGITWWFFAGRHDRHRLGLGKQLPQRTQAHRLDRRPGITQQPRDNPRRDHLLA
jgi:DDE superfamily endonuclease